MGRKEGSAAALDDGWGTGTLGCCCSGGGGGVLAAKTVGERG